MRDVIAAVCSDEGRRDSLYANGELFGVFLAKLRPCAELSIICDMIRELKWIRYLAKMTLAYTAVDRKKYKYGLQNLLK